MGAYGSYFKISRCRDGRKCVLRDVVSTNEKSEVKRSHHVNDDRHPNNSLGILPKYEVICNDVSNCNTSTVTFGQQVPYKYHRIKSNFSFNNNSYSLI